MIDLNFLVIIPTRNRGQLLSRLVKNLEYSLLKPLLVVIVDSSDLSQRVQINSSILQISQLFTEQKSAAKQRNIGIDYVLSRQEIANIGFLSFLDDDVLVPEDYFTKVSNFFLTHQNAVGLSGITLPNSDQTKFRNWMTDYLGLTGQPGTLTKSAINISPIGLRSISEVDWLIGCSNWRIYVLSKLKFENDFEGSSIFEDVIFSVRAREYGELWCDPCLVFFHELTVLNRSDVNSQFFNWVINRDRLFRYSIPGVSRTKALTLNILLYVYSRLIGIFDRRSRMKAKGIFRGLIALAKSEKENQ